jgi:hypothetical protein
MATHFRISYGKWRQPCHIGAAQSRLTNPARVARRQDCDSHQKLVLIRSGALRLEILFEVSYPAPALFNGGRVDGSFRRVSPVSGRAVEGLLTEPTAATQPGRRQPLLMPLKRPCRRGRGMARLECIADLRQFRSKRLTNPIS